MKRYLLSSSLLFCLLLAGCDGQHPLPDDERPTLDAFRAAGPVWEFDAAYGQLQTGTLMLPGGGKVGGTAEHALVRLHFDEGGRLYSRDAFDALIEKPVGASAKTQPSRVYATDLETYRRATGDVRATARYAVHHPGFGNPDDVTFWVFDPYVRCELYVTDGPSTLPACTANRNVQAALSKSMALNPPLVNRGDMIIGRRASSNPLGHSGVVYALNTGGVRGGDPWNTSTLTMEARGFAKDHGDPIFVPRTAADEVSVVPLRNYFLDGTAEFFELLRVPNLTDAQRIAIADKAKAWDPKRYFFPSPKSDPLTTYCFKLNWSAVKDATGIDIDADGGDWILLWDFRYSPRLERVYLWDKVFAP